MNFANRHIGVDSRSEKIMLEYLGISDTEELIRNHSARNKTQKRHQPWKKR